MCFRTDTVTQCWTELSFDSSLSQSVDLNAGFLSHLKKIQEANNLFTLFLLNQLTDFPDLSKDDSFA